MRPLTPNMLSALKYLATLERPETSCNRIGRKLDIRHRKGNYRGQQKTYGIGAAANTVCKALESRGLAEKVLTDDHISGELTHGWRITESGRQKLSEASDTV